MSDRSQLESSTAAVTLLAAVMGAPAERTADVLHACRPEDVQLIDAPTAAALDVARALANDGRSPDAIQLKDECLRRGILAGHHGSQVCERLATAVTTLAYPERLPEYAAAVLAQVFRIRLAAAGEALTAGVAEQSPESDLWLLLLREGAALRDIRDRLTTVRGDHADV